MCRDDLVDMFSEVLTRTDTLVLEQYQAVKKAKKGQVKVRILRETFDYR